MQVFFGMNNTVEKSQDVQACSKPRRRPQCLQAAFQHCRCRALLSKAMCCERLTQPGDATLKWQQQMQTCLKKQRMEKLRLGNDGMYYWWLSSQKTWRLQHVERIMGLSSFCHERTWRGLKRGSISALCPPCDPSAWSHSAQQGKQLKLSCNVCLPQPTPIRSTPPHVQHTLHLSSFFLSWTSFPTASAFPDFKSLIGFLQRANTFSEINFGLQLLKRYPFTPGRLEAGSARSYGLNQNQKCTKQIFPFVYWRAYFLQGDSRQEAVCLNSKRFAGCQKAPFSSLITFYSSGREFCKEYMEIQQRSQEPY